MKTITKENGQIFEICTSKKEFTKSIADMDNCQPGSIWENEDSNLYLKYKDGSEVCYSKGDVIQPLKLRQVAQGYEDNSATYVMYNCGISYNAHYEDWEIKL